MDTSDFHTTINLPSVIQQTEFTRPGLKQKPVYDYNRFKPDPDDAFEETINYLSEIEDVISESHDQTYSAHLIESMTMLIYTSNHLEGAGCSYFLTSAICKQLLVGRVVTPTNELTDKDAEYQLIKSELTKQQQEGKTEEAAVFRARTQIIQHIYALKYIFLHFVVKGEQLSEELLKETHQILTHGIHAENQDKDDSKTYGGVYRSDDVAWTFTAFAHPSAIQKRMTETMQTFNTEVKKAQVKGCLDPYALATKYFHIILNIHPFLDGNCRLCRLFLNAVLLKYTGIVIPIGRDSKEADKWKETVTRASIVELEDEEERGKKAAWAEIATLVAIQGGSTLKALVESLQEVKEGAEYKSIIGYDWGILDEEVKEEKEEEGDA